MRTSTKSNRAALLWDESYIWGLISHDALVRLGLAFDIVTSDDIRAGALESYGMIFVPGGWASNKIKALGEGGANAIIKYVREGGMYFGICGGAGLATSDGLGLLRVERKPTRQRVPSLSGPVILELDDSTLWRGVRSKRFTIWWPSQLVNNHEGARVPARFGHATGVAMSSDLPVRDSASSWAPHESRYGINLDPARMHGDPMLIDGICGEGRALLSLVHFDTPGDRNGEIVLSNIWQETGLAKSNHKMARLRSPGGRLYVMARELYMFGLRNFLWYERGPMIQWRRGIRGLEYYNLYVMAARLSRHRHIIDKGRMQEIEEVVDEFCRGAERLLIAERAALDSGIKLTYAEGGETSLTQMREAHFSRSKSYGGFYKRVLDMLDNALLSCMRSVMVGLPR